MPGGEKLPRCPKGEVRDKKTKKCVKKDKTSPKNNTTKKVSPKKISPKKISPKKNTPKKSVSTESNSFSSKKSAIKMPVLTNLKFNKKSDTEYYRKYIHDLLSKMLNESYIDTGVNNKGHKFDYYELGELEDFIKEEINHIKKENKSKYVNYVFTTDTSKQSVDFLNKYIPYFDKVADEEFRVRASDVRKLYD
jgi:hypothetical protein